MMMDAIGGYFGLELNNGKHYHNGAIKLNTARNCFEYILNVRMYSKVYIPYYTCNVMLEPLNKLGVDYEFYHIDKLLEPQKRYELKSKEAFLYTNYYGLKQNCVIELAKIYGKQLIVDNAQAFFERPIKNIDTFYSARKFFGVSDGAYLFTDKELEADLEQDISYNRMSHLLKRIDTGAESGYTDLRQNDDSLIENPILRMSNLTNAILQGVDYDSIKIKRRENYLWLHKHLADVNNVSFDLIDNTAPMVYPFGIKNGCKIRRLLNEKRIFIATYWHDVVTSVKKESLEYDLSMNIVALPIDSRYTVSEMDIIISTIKNNINNEK